MAYTLLGAAIALELMGTTLLKYTMGFTRLYPTLACLAAYGLCFYCFSKALNSINLGVAYATWSAVGIVVSAIISALLFGEKLNAVGVASIVLIITGCVLLNLLGTGSLRDNSAAKYMVLVGENTGITDRIENADVLVIDAEAFTAEEIAELKEKNIGEIYSYLNIGSIEKYRSYYKEYEKYTLAEYENWPDERWIDVSQPKWQSFIEGRAEALLDKGVDGVFVDNTDVFYLYPEDEIYEGIISVLSHIKGLNKKVIINGGDSFVKKYIASGEKKAVFDGVNQESVYTKYDFANKVCAENSKADREYYTDYLNEVKDKGYAVYVLEYADDPALAKKAKAYSKKRSYTCYVSDNIELVYSR